MLLYNLNSLVTGEVVLEISVLDQWFSTGGPQSFFYFTKNQDFRHKVHENDKKSTFSATKSSRNNKMSNFFTQLKDRKTHKMFKKDMVGRKIVYIQFLVDRHSSNVENHCFRRFTYQVTISPTFTRSFNACRSRKRKKYS